MSFKNSVAFSEHKNSKKHNALLGMSMKVEKVTVDRISEKLAGLKRKNNKRAPESIESIMERLEEKEAP